MNRWSIGNCFLIWFESPQSEKIQEPPISNTLVSRFVGLSDACIIHPQEHHVILEPWSIISLWVHPTSHSSLVISIHYKSLKCSVWFWSVSEEFYILVCRRVFWVHCFLSLWIQLPPNFKCSAMLSCTACCHSCSAEVWLPTVPWGCCWDGQNFPSARGKWSENRWSWYGTTLLSLNWLTGLPQTTCNVWLGSLGRQEHFLKKLEDFTLISVTFVTNIGQSQVWNEQQFISTVIRIL